MAHATRVLVTCVGSGVGQSVVDSLRHLKERYFLVGSDQNRFCFPMPDCDDFISLPPIADPRYLDSLLEVCAALRIDVVIPGHDLELPLLARNRSRFDAAGVQVLVGNARLVALSREKLAWSRELGARTRHIVTSCSVAEYRQGSVREAIALPAIAKPAGGSASAGLRIVHRLEDIEGLADDYTGL